MLNRMIKTAVSALAALLLASCGSGTVHGIDLAITDAPLDVASSVNISFTRIEFSGPSLTPTILDIVPATTIDLFQLQGGLAQGIVGSIQAQPGHYTTLTMTILADSASAQSTITLPDGVHILYLPQGVSSRIQMPLDFNFAGGTDLAVTVDFDLRKSIIVDPNDPTKYQLIPSMRAVLNRDAGAITGTVATALVTCLDPAIYVYQGNLITPTDVDIDAPPGTLQPYTTALVGLNATSGLYNFTVGFLPAGDYTIAYTCGATLDVANQANQLSFSHIQHVAVRPQNNTFVTIQ
jgi:hypothetical protein